MPARKLDHYTIRSADLERTRDFYAGLLGLSVGPRPNFSFAGYWLYCGDTPTVHLVAKDGAVGTIDDRDTTGRLDHIAFRGEGYDAMVATLKDKGIAFRENAVRDFNLRQLFLRDPDGILVELNFHD
jgi:catechol 2,3-dioxygenase-like lactoylglutathione lyase family enzyme